MITYVWSHTGPLPHEAASHALPRDSRNLQHDGGGLGQVRASCQANATLASPRSLISSSRAPCAHPRALTCTHKHPRHTHARAHSRTHLPPWPPFTTTASYCCAASVAEISRHMYEVRA